MARVRLARERRVRQGCPLSGLLFVIGIELLSSALQKDPTIRGIQVGQKEMKITQYANDTTVSGARSRFRFAVAEARVIPSASERSHHRFPMKLGLLMLQDKEILKT